MKKGQGWARRVTLQNLADFAPWLRQIDDAQLEAEKQARKAKKVAAAGKPSPFRGVPLGLPSRFRPKRQGKKATAPREARTIAPKRKLTQVAGERGRFLWSRELSASDAQKTWKPTGCVRLIQAPDENVQEIDQTTFFRREVFSRSRWAVIKTNPFVEATEIDFHITLNGESIGIHRQRVRHKPSGEAGQHNYTTSWHWGELMKLAKAKVRPGQKFSLFAPPARKRTPFYIEIS